MISHWVQEEHDRNIIKVFEQLKEHGIKLILDTCHLGLMEIKCFGMNYSKEGMSKDPEKMD